ncbi:MAG: trigger factor [Cohaesibacteraceae bacterium]|nr:trigger factor [Cohaesibacteraceae bacterium]
MQVTETLSEGLKRQLKVVVPAADMNGRLETRLVDMKDKVRINGFRPGKVPVSHIRKLYGRSVMGEIVQEILNETTAAQLKERGEKSAAQPQFDMTEDEDEASMIMDGKADFEFTLKYEVLPEIVLGDFKGINVERPVVDVSEKEIDDRINQIADGSRPFDEKKGKAADGDRVTIDYLGKVDGESFDGGEDKDAKLVLGSGQFIPGFEEQVVGLKAGDEKVLELTFPADYGSEKLAGKDATFDIVVKSVEAPGELEIDDEFAKKFGIDSLDELRKTIQQQIESQHGNLTRQRVKRQLLDALDDMHKFDSPPSMLEQEFKNIWDQILREMEESGKSFEDEDTSEEEAREEYTKIAERRVRLGLVLSEIGEKNEIKVTDEEVQRAVMSQAQRFPGQEKQVWDFYSKNTDALASIRAPVFEEKVVDFLLELANVTDKTVTKEELEKLAEDSDDE